MNNNLPPLTLVQQRIYNRIAAAADAGQKCPTNGDLADIAENAGAIVRLLADKGYIEIESVDSCTRTITIKATGAKTAGKPRSQPVKPDKKAGQIGVVEQRVYQALVRAAEAGERCPANDELMSIPGSVSGAICRLIRKGFIEVKSESRHRVVRIVATGKCTAGTVKNAHWRTQADYAGKAKPQAPGKPAKPSLPSELRMTREQIMARADADRERKRRERLSHLEVEQQRYRLPKMGRLIDEMPA